MNQIQIQKKREELQAVIDAANEELSDVKREEKSYNFDGSLSLQKEVGIAFVKSETNATIYAVDLLKYSCECPDHQYRGVQCKHLRAAMRAINNTKPEVVAL